MQLRKSQRCGIKVNLFSASYVQKWGNNLLLNDRRLAISIFSLSNFFRFLHDSNMFGMHGEIVVMR